MGSRSPADLPIRSVLDGDQEEVEEEEEEEVEEEEEGEEEEEEEEGEVEEEVEKEGEEEEVVEEEEVGSVLEQHLLYQKDSLLFCLWSGPSRHGQWKFWILLD